MGRIRVPWVVWFRHRHCAGYREFFLKPVQTVMTGQSLLDPRPTGAHSTGNTTAQCLELPCTTAGEHLTFRRCGDKTISEFHGRD